MNISVMKKKLVLASILSVVAPLLAAHPASASSRTRVYPGSACVSEYPGYETTLNRRNGITNESGGTVYISCPFTMDLDSTFPANVILNVSGKVGYTDLNPVAGQDLWCFLNVNNANGGNQISGVLRSCPYDGGCTDSTNGSFSGNMGWWTINTSSWPASATVTGSIECALPPRTSSGSSGIRFFSVNAAYN